MVDVLDDYRVRAAVKQPSAPFLANLAFAMIVAKENVEKIGVEPIGTGPFRFIERVPNSHLLVRKWEKFYVPGQPKVDEIRWVPTVEPSTRVANLKTNTVDIISEVPFESLADLRATPGIAIQEPKASSAYAVILIKHAPPLDNKKLRQALAMLVDRESLHRVVYYGVGTTAQGCNPFPVGQPIFLREADPDGLVVSALFTGGQNNPGGYSTKDMDTLLTQGRGELSLEKWKAIYKKIAEIVADDVPFIRLQPQPFLWASTAKVGGFYVNSQSRPFVALREMTLGK